MLVELGVDLATGAGPTLMVGLLLEDVARLRAGEQLSITLRDAGLILPDQQEPRTLVIALGNKTEPKQPGRFLLTEGAIEWIRDTIPLSEKLADLGFPEGKVIVFHGKTDEDTATAVRRHKERLARTLIPDTSVVTTYTLDKQSGHVSVARFERQPRRSDSPPASEDAPPNWSLVLASAVGSVAAFAGAFSHRDVFGLCIAIGVTLAAVSGWSLRRALRAY